MKTSNNKKIKLNLNKICIVQLKNPVSIKGGQIMTQTNTGGSVFPNVCETEDTITNAAAGYSLDPTCI